MVETDHTQSAGDRSGPDPDSLRLFKPCSEAEWLSCHEVDSLCKVLRHRDYGVTVRFNDRKWQLFGAACVRRVCHTFQDERTSGLVEGVERLADGLLTEEEVRQDRSQVRNPPNQDTEFPEDWQSEEGMARSAYQALLAIPLRWADAARAADSARWARRATRQPDREERAQVTLLRDVFGNPFRPVSLDPSWRTPTVLALAQAAYRERLLPSKDLDPSRSPSWPTRWKRLVARTGRSWITSVGRVRIFEPVGPLTWFSPGNSIAKESAPASSVGS